MLLPAVDPSAVLQFVLSAIAVLFVSLLLVRKVSSRYFVVDGMSIGGAGGGDGGGKGCTSCGRTSPPPRKCTRCQGVAYCSTACQSKHWEAGHKAKCKQARSSDEVDGVPSENGARRRKKSSGFDPVSLKPARGKCNLLQEPTRILFRYDEFVKLFKWDYPEFPPCGLLNCGNSCFANVVLQCLTCTRPLAAYLLEKNHSSGCIRKQEGWCFLCELQVHVQRAVRNREPFSPINILSRLPNIGGNLGYGSQEDAHEFMRFAIDTMQSICLDEYGGEKALDPSTQETTLIQHIFGGHLQSQVICTKCNAVSNRYENMMDLTVEIHGDAESLEECLEQFTVKEWLDGENMYKCDGCNDYVKAWKRLTVHKAPNILTIALKRFQSGRFGKLNKRVTFPEDLNLTPFMSGNEDGTDAYSLYAVVVHLDMLNASFFGHYICYVKDFGGHWYRIDDCKVIIVDVEEVLSQGAYMLLYSRKSPRREPFIRPIKPVKEKQLALGDNNLSNTAKAADSSCAIASLPCNASSQSNLSLRDIGHDRDFEVNFDGLMGKVRGGMESVTPSEVNPMLDPINLSNVDITYSDLCSLVMKDREGNSSQFPQVSVDVLPVSLMNSNLVIPVEHAGAEGQAMECEEYNGRCDTDFRVEEDPGSLGHGEEVCTSSGYARDGSFSCKNMAHNIVHDIGETSSSASSSSSVVVDPEGLHDSNCKSESVMVACDVPANEVNKLADICSSKVSKAFAPCSENVSLVKPKPLFSRGFLERPTRESSVDREGSSEPNVSVVAVVPKANGFTSGPLLLDSGTNSANLESSSDGNKNVSAGKPKPLFSRGFLDRPTVERPLDHENNQLDVPKANGFINGHLDFDSDANSASLESFHDGSQNDSPGKQKHLFSRGFLDRPTRVACEKRTQSDVHSVNVVAKVNGFTNGHFELESVANYASSKSFSDRTNSGSLHPDSSDTDFMASAQKRSYGKLAAGLKNEQINCKGSAELALVTEASSSSWTSNTSSHGTVHDQENGSTTYRNDAASFLK